MNPYGNFGMNYGQEVNTTANPAAATTTTTASPPSTSPNLTNVTTPTLSGSSPTTPNSLGKTDGPGLMNYQREKYGPNLFIKNEEGFYTCFFLDCNKPLQANFSRHISRHEQNGDQLDPAKVKQVGSPILNNSKKENDMSPMMISVNSNNKTVSPPLPTQIALTNNVVTTPNITPPTTTATTAIASQPITASTVISPTVNPLLPVGISPIVSNTTIAPSMISTPVKQNPQQTISTPQQPISTPTHSTNTLMGTLGFPVSNFINPSTTPTHPTNTVVPTTPTQFNPFIFNANLQSPQNLQQQIQLQLLQQQAQQQQAQQQTPSKITPTRAAAVAATAAAQSQITEVEIPQPEQKPGVTYQTCQHPLHSKWWGTSSLLPINEFYPRASKCKKCYIKQQQDARKSRTQPNGPGGLPIIDDSLSNITPIKNLPFYSLKPQTPNSLNLTPHHLGGLPLGFTPNNQIVSSPFTPHSTGMIMPNSNTPHQIPASILTGIPSVTSTPNHQIPASMIGGIPSRQQNELLKQQYLLQQNQATLQHAQAQLLQAQAQAHFDDRDLTPEEKLARQAELQKAWGRQGFTKQGFRPKQRPNKQYIRREMFERLKRYLIKLLQDKRAQSLDLPKDFSEKIKDQQVITLSDIEKKLFVTISELQQTIIFAQETEDSEKQERQLQEEIEKQHQEGQKPTKYFEIKQIDNDFRSIFNNVLEYYKDNQTNQVYQFAKELEEEYHVYFKVNLEEVLYQASYQCELLKFVCDGCKQPPISYQQPPTVDINGNIHQESTEVLPLVTCQGSCSRSFHLHCLGLLCTAEQSRQPYICRECIHGKPVLHYDPEENQYFYFYYEGINANQNAQEDFKLNLSASLKSQLLNLINNNNDNNDNSDNSNNDDINSNDQIISDIGALNKEEKVQLRKGEEGLRTKEMYYDPYWCMWRKKITSKRDERQKPILENSLKKKAKRI